MSSLDGAGLMEAAIYGLLAGLVATAVMSVPQYFFWRRWSTIGILEWHENQVIASKLTGRGPEDSFLIGFLFHFANGGIAAMAYGVVIALLPQLSQLGPLILGSGFGVLLWVFTLALIHWPLTGVSIRKHPLGWRPSVLSIALHILYGTVVAYIVDVNL
ncbi:MAG: hypothetical protein NZ988_01175 [Thaumarchaeota archaeon]|nr:hypothetical protein [Candidatus Calditenuaceae archaeon]MDW8186645.1 hypothetical protein [Nitrososphaerota archaeon]